MTRLLPILSVAAVWTFLGALIVGLLRILQALVRIRRTLDKIAMGVRAIEQETAPLGSHLGHAVNGLTTAGSGLGAIAHGLGQIDSDLHAAVPAVRKLAARGSSR